MKWNYIERDGKPDVAAEGAYFVAILLESMKLVGIKQWLRGEWKTDFFVYAWAEIPDAPPLEPPEAK